MDFLDSKPPNWYRTVLNWLHDGNKYLRIMACTLKNKITIYVTTFM